MHFLILFPQNLKNKEEMEYERGKQNTMAVIQQEQSGVSGNLKGIVPPPTLFFLFWQKLGRELEIAVCSVK